MLRKEKSTHLINNNDIKYSWKTIRKIFYILNTMPIEFNKINMSLYFISVTFLLTKCIDRFKILHFEILYIKTFEQNSKKSLIKVLKFSNKISTLKYHYDVV